MNILVIGNGFDLAHDLPTMYKDFLKFVEQICRIKTFRGDVNKFEAKMEESKYDKFNELNKDVANYIDAIIRDKGTPNKNISVIYQQKKNPIICEIIKLSEKNVWIEWFKESDTLVNEGWIDFESEISNVIQQIEVVQDALITKIIEIETIKEKYTKGINFLEKLEKNIKNKRGTESLQYVYRKLSDLKESDFREYKTEMISDLNDLIRCLELYLENCIKNIDKSVLSPDIFELKVDKVLSFNYTNTYERLYSCKNRFAEYDYIHGKSQITDDTLNNMVLGIDEYLNDDERNVNTRFVEFKKYFQRIHKSTGCIYKKWIEKISKSNKDDNNIYIFGHSLDITDKEVFKELVTCKNIKTTIFYKDADRYGQQIANLVKILGQDELISMVYGENKRIEFIMQRDMIDKSNTEWQILNDIYSLWHLYKMNTPQAELLIEGINKNIKDNVLSYFHNQENVISLYNVLINTIGISDSQSEQLLNIAYKLMRKDQLEKFDAKDWNDYDYTGEHACNRKTFQMISTINSYNQQNTQTIKSISELDIIHLDKLCNEIRSCIIDWATFKQIFDHLFLMFDESNSDVDLIWKCIFQLVEKVDNKDFSTFFMDKLSDSEKDTIKINRLNYLNDVIEEEKKLEEITYQRR